MRYVIVGGGVAGNTAAREIRGLDPEGDITLVTDEPVPFYTRIRLPELLSGRLREEDLILHGREWYERRRIEVMLQVRVVNLDASGRRVETSRGDGLEYDRLLLATGSEPFVPPIAGAGREGVHTLRHLSDARAIRELVGDGGHTVAIVGGGILGLETGHNLLMAGNRVVVVELMDRLLPKQTDPRASEILQKDMERMGFEFHIGVGTQEMMGGDGVKGLLLTDDTRLECDCVIVAAGVRSNVGLAEPGGLEVSKGFVVDDRMETSAPGVYAAGDAACHEGRTYGIWPAAEAQGRVAGINMAGGDATFSGFTPSNRLKVVGIDLFAAGNIDPDGELEAVVHAEPDSHIYKKLVIEGGRIVGTILLGDIGDAPRITRAIGSGADVASVLDRLGDWDLGPLDGR